MGTQVETTPYSHSAHPPLTTSRIEQRFTFPWVPAFIFLVICNGKARMLFQNLSSWHGIQKHIIFAGHYFLGTHFMDSFSQSAEVNTECCSRRKFTESPKARSLCFPFKVCFETWPFGQFKVSSLEKDVEGEIVGTRLKGPNGAYSTGVQSAETPLSTPKHFFFTFLAWLSQPCRSRKSSAPVRKAASNIEASPGLSGLMSQHALAPGHKWSNFLGFRPAQAEATARREACSPPTQNHERVI